MVTNNSEGDIRSEVKAIAVRQGISEERAFAAWYAINIYGIDEDSAIEAASYDGGEDQGIDFLLTDLTNERIIVLQAHFPAKPENVSPKKKWDCIFSSITAIEQPKIFKDVGKLELYDAANEAKDKFNEFEVVCGLISFGNKSSQIQRSKEAADNNIRYSNISFIYDSFESIVQRYEAIKEGESGVSEDTIEFYEGKYFIDKGGYGVAYVGSVKAPELHRLYNKYSDELFARNIRLFLGSRKGGINQRIIETAKETPGQFWALNNGITIVASSVTEIEKGKFKITRFSIVNGCQTTVCIAKAGAPDEAKVLVRIVEANERVLGDIVRYNNTQNAIKIWTVRAADQIQEKIRKEINKHGVIYAPKPNEKRSFEATEIIPLDKIAQYLAAGNTETLISAVKEKSELFDRYYQILFPTSISPDTVYLYWQIGKWAEEERGIRIQELKEQEDADKMLTNFLGVAGVYWTILTTIKFMTDLNKKVAEIKIDDIKTTELQSSIKKYVAKGLDTYLDIAIDTYEPTEYGSVRSALRSPKFLTKFNQKLSNKVAREKTNRKLPNIDGTLTTIRNKNK
jgi:hypothetical protein